MANEAWAMNGVSAWLRRLLTLKAWRKRARELVELFVLPGLMALLPWRFSRSCLRRMAKLQSLYRDEVQPAEEFAHRAGVATDRAAFGHRLRWRLLIEHMDAFLVPLRSSRYVRRWVRVSGDPLPASGPLFFIGTHYGCGYWFLPYVREAGLSPSIVAPQLAPLLVNASLLQNVYARLRHYMLTRVTGRALLYRGNAAAGLREVLRAGEVGFGLCDMPSDRSDAFSVTLAGRSTRISTGMFALASAENVPVYLFMADTDLETGYRTMHFERAIGSPKEQLDQLMALLDRQLQRDPSGWRFWSIGSSFFPELADRAEASEPIAASEAEGSPTG